MISAAHEWFVGVAWQAALVACLVAAIDLLLPRGRFVHLRHAMWLAVLIRFVLPPDLGSPWSVAGAVRKPVMLTEWSSIPVEDATAGPWFVSAWLVGAAVCMARRAVGAVRSRRRLLDGAMRPSNTLMQRIELVSRETGCRVPSRVVVSAAASGPAVFGWVRATLVLPISAESESASAALGHALRHEFAHLRRRDLLVGAFASLVRSVWWFHPAAWVAESRLAVLREACCDLDAARACGDALSYRESLVDALRRSIGAPQSPRLLGWSGAAAAVSARLSALDRLAAAMRRGAPGLRVPAPLAAALFAVSCATLLPLAPPPLEGPALWRRIAAEGPDVHGCIRVHHAVHALVALEASSVPVPNPQQEPLR